MNAERARLLQQTASEFPELRALAKLLLEIAGYQVFPDSPPTNEGPITAEELERRGTDSELEARAIDVVLRCGWPDRAKHRVNVEPCVPVPVSVLERMRDDLLTNGPGVVAVGRVLDRLGPLLFEQKRISGLYVEALPDLGPLPEREAPR